MGILCDNIEERDRKLNKIKIKGLNKVEQNTKIKLTAYEAQINLLEKEIIDLNNKLKTNNGNITNQNKKEMEADLLAKVIKCKKLYTIRRNLKTNLGEIDDIKIDNDFNIILKDVNDVIKNNIGDHEDIDANIDALNERKTNSDIRNRQLEDGQGMIDGRKTEFEKRQIIKDFIESQNP